MPLPYLCRYSGIKEKRGNTYSYNPCSTYQDTLNKGACDDVHVSSGSCMLQACSNTGIPLHSYFYLQMCQDDKYVIGGAPGDEEIWIDTDGTPYAFYKNPSSE